MRYARRFLYSLPYGREGATHVDFLLNSCNITNFKCGERMNLAGGFLLQAHHQCRGKCIWVVGLNYKLFVIARSETTKQSSLQAGRLSKKLVHNTSIWTATGFALAVTECFTFTPKLAVKQCLVIDLRLT